MYKWIGIKCKADYQKLEEALVSDEYGLRPVIEKLQLRLNDSVKGILVEHPYVDKDYRSTYYHYYAKKGALYNPNCARIHFFVAGWSLNTAPFSLLDPAGNPAGDSITEGYLGFMVLRPTRVYTIGRTVISPSAIQDMSGRVIESSHKTHVLGHKLSVSGFPFMQQHGDIAVCSHTACWAILRHYSERYSVYAEVLLHDIAKLGREFNPGGLLPSLGISFVDAERIFAQLGTFPLFVPRPSDKEHWHEFYTDMLAYLDSGFPLFGVQSDNNHAMAIVGYRSGSDLQIQPAQDARPTLWNFTSHLLAIDDNQYPYMPVPREAKEGDGNPYDFSAIDGFLVPLPEKMFLPASAAVALANSLTDPPPDNFDDLATIPVLVIRHFLTTTPAWHRHIRKSAGSLPHEFTDAALELSMPQFIWVVEYASPEQWAKGEVQARLVLDATAGTYEPFPAFLLYDRKGALWVDRATRRPMSYQPFTDEAGPLPRMDSNLVNY